MADRGLWVVVLIVLVAAGAAAGGAAWYLSSHPPGGSAQDVRLVIAESGGGSYAYSASTFHATPGALLHLTIVNYDPMNHTTDWRYCNVSGALGGVMGWGYGGMMSGGMMGGSSPMHGLAPRTVSHTFTISGSGWSVNVPIPPAHSTTEPAIVSFTLQIPATGTYEWSCEAAGMEGELSPGGGMMGTLVVS